MYLPSITVEPSNFIGTTSILPSSPKGRRSLLVDVEAKAMAIVRNNEKTTTRTTKATRTTIGIVLIVLSAVNQVSSFPTPDSRRLMITTTETTTMSESSVPSTLHPVQKPPSTRTRNNDQQQQKQHPKNKNIATENEYGGDKEELIYKSGIPTLRSSAHRVKFDVKRRTHDPKPKDHNGIETKTTWLPDDILKEDIFEYDIELYNLPKLVMNLLQSCDKSFVGKFARDDDNDDDDHDNDDHASWRLEDFRVPTEATWRKVNGGRCEDSQKILSDAVASNVEFLTCFERFVEEVVLPYFKGRLELSGVVSAVGTPTTFYYQYPPTMRLQPGPGWAKVKPHNDAEYGHQNGELNFWIPLTEREWTQVDLWCETTFGQEDYHAIPAKVGQGISFHGSSCRHFVNANKTCHTRVSLDFRIGVQGYFDPYWQMKGTTDDHGRREVTI